MTYLEQANLAVEAARKMSGCDAEAYILDAKSLTVEVSNAVVETLKFSEDVGIGLRLISSQGAVGFAYSTDLTDLEQLTKQALANSNNAQPDKYNTLPVSAAKTTEVNLLDKKIAAVTIDEKINLAKQVEASALQSHAKVRRTERCVYDETEYGVALASTNGVSTYYRSGYCGLYGIVLAEKDGDIQSGMSLQYVRDFNRLKADEIGREAAADAVMLLGAKRIETTKAALILTPHIATSFLSILIPALCADSVQKGRSLFKNRTGQKVVSSLISLIDDGQLSEGIATRPIDGEGVPTQRTHLITKGVLSSYLYNTYTAAKDGVASTGNGSRASFKSMPEVGPTNLFIQAGTSTRDQLIQEVKNGFYVTNVMGMHTANPISGDFSVGASGVWIRDGKFTHSVRGVAIAGNILDLLSEVDGVADDLRFYGSQGSPSIRMQNVTVSGS